MRHYLSADEDSARWDGFAFREGDVVVSTRSKSGTTWVQLVCALLVHGARRPSELPEPLGTLSPWLDHTVEPVADVLARLEAQPHRRVVKTHTPLDGVPSDPRATYVVAARHPLDMAVSLFHQGANIDRERVAELTGVPARSGGPRPTVHDWLVGWTQEQTTPQQHMDSLVGVLHHVTDAWQRATAAPDVVLVHYADLLADLPGQVARLADRLGVDAGPDRVAQVAAATTFEAMQGGAADLAPGAGGVLRDPRAFFRSGRSGEGRALLTPAERTAYDVRVAALAPPDVLAWLHR